MRSALNSSPLVLAFAASLVACSSFGTGPLDGGAEGGSATSPNPTSGGAARTCLDSDGKEATACAVPFGPTECDAADRNLACATVVKEELRAAPRSGDAGNCVHLVVRNDCGSTTYSYTCIELSDDRVHSQCWQSTTQPGGTVDVAQCRATGRYSRVSSLSKGTLTVLQAQCPPPSPL